MTVIQSCSAELARIAALMDYLATPAAEPPPGGCPVEATKPPGMDERLHADRLQDCLDRYRAALEQVLRTAPPTGPADAAAQLQLAAREVEHLHIPQPGERPEAAAERSLDLARTLAAARWHLGGDAQGPPPLIGLRQSIRSIVNPA